MSSGAIIIGGVEYPCSIPVQPWAETGYHFAAHTRPRAHPTRWVVLHWTGAENRAADVYRNMATRRNPQTGRAEPLCVHFVVDQLGEIYQMADAQIRGAHCAARGGNAWSVGIEIVNRGHALQLPDKGFKRPLRVELVHGQRVKYGDFFHAQIVAATALTRALCEAYGLPLTAPTGPDGDVLARSLTDVELEAYRGPLGHYHLEAGKPDPAPELLRRIAAAGATSRIG